MNISQSDLLEYLELYRAGYHLSQKVLARQLGISHSYYRMIIHGRRSVTTKFYKSAFEFIMEIKNKKEESTPCHTK